MLPNKVRRLYVHVGVSGAPGMSVRMYLRKLHHATAMVVAKQSISDANFGDAPGLLMVPFYDLLKGLIRLMEESLPVIL